MGKLGNQPKKSFIASYIDRMLPSTIMSQIVMNVSTVIDAALTGQFLGAQALAAEGMVMPVVMLIIAMASIMSAGNATICSNESGQGNVAEINKVFSTTLVVSVSISLVATVLIIIFVSPICQLLGLTPGTGLFMATRDFMIGYVPLMPVLALIMVLPAIFQLEGDNVTNIIAVVLIFVLNIVFALLNLFVVHGGVLGMALATTFSYYISAVVVLFRFCNRKHIVSFSIKNVDLSRVGELISYGTPAFINSLSLGLMTAALNGAFLSFNSELHVTALAIVFKVGTILLCFGNGMGEMTAMVTGLTNGEDDREGLKEILKIMFRYAVLVNALIIIVSWLSGDWSIRLFTAEDDILQLGEFGLRIFALQFIFRGLLIVYVGYLRGIQRFMISNIVLMSMAILAALFARIAPLYFGVDAIWYSYVVSTLLSFIVVLCIVSFVAKKNPFALDTLLLKPDSYGIRDEDYLEMAVTNIDELCAYCETAQKFALERGGNSKQAYRLSLAMEEMGKNILQWSFNDDKEHLLMIRVMYDKDGFRLRFRDNGRQFNPEDFYRAHAEDVQPVNFGIRMVFQTASDVIYLNTMNLNNLMIKIT